MIWWLSASMLFGVLTALFLIGLPAAFAFLGINVAGAWFYLGKEAGLAQLIRNGVVSITSFSLTPIPFFILMVIAVALIWVFPDIVSYLPSKMFRVG